MSPDIDLRHSAKLGLGSNIATPANRRLIWQGGALNKQKALKLTDVELEKQTALLPKELKPLIVNRPVCLTEYTTASYLKEWCFSACDKWQTNRIDYDATRLQYILDLRDERE